MLLSTSAMGLVLLPPLLIIVAAGIARRGRPELFVPVLSTLLTMVLAASLWASTTLSSDIGPSAYYATHTRLWEMGAGAALALLLPRVRGGRRSPGNSLPVTMSIWSCSLGRSPTSVSSSTRRGELIEDGRETRRRWRAGASRSFARYAATGADVLVIRDTPWAPTDVPTCLSEHDREPATCGFALDDTTTGLDRMLYEERGRQPTTRP